MEVAAAAAGAGGPPLAVANNGALPRDVLHDILLDLGADEVCRLRLVCRSWRSVTYDPLFVAAHASRHPHVVVVVVSQREGSSQQDAEVRAVDLHGRVIKRRRVRWADGSLGRLSVSGDLLCASHGWGLASVVDMVTGAVVADVTAEHRRTVNASKPECVLGHVPSTGEYKVLRVQANPQQTFEVVTIGSGGAGAGAGRWRRRRRPPVSVGIELSFGSGNLAVVAGLAYFLVCPGELKDGQLLSADSLAVFDLATEEWKPATLQGPLSSSSGSRGGSLLLLGRKRFQLARLGDSLVMLYCDVELSLTELWFLENMEDDDDMAARWSRRYTLQRTTFTENVYAYSSLRYHHPLAVLDDGKILVSVEATFRLPSAMRAYDPETGEWTELWTTTGDCVVGMHRGSLLCSNLGAA